MSYVTLPIRIRPSRVRLTALGGVLAAMAVPMYYAAAEQWPQVAAVLAEPSLTWPFAGAVTVSLFATSYVLFLIGFALVVLPGAPMLHVDVDERGVTYRRLWYVTRVSFRDTDGWGYVERAIIPVSAEVPAGTRLYTVVAGRGGFDGHRVRDNQRYAMDINVLPFTPLFQARESFAQDFALCLSAAGRGARQSRRPIVIDVAPWIAELSFPLVRRPVRAPRQQRPGKAKAATVRASGRFSSHADKAAYWRSEAFQAMRARDDSPAEARASNLAYFHGQFAKRERKQAARERRALDEDSGARR
jgi:hypothetical protein